MRLHKGKLYDYCATGEPFHYYCWTGDSKAEQHDWEHHILIEARDVVEIISPDKQHYIVFHNFPENAKALKKYMGKHLKIWVKAVVEHWDIHVCKFGEPETDS